MKKTIFTLLLSNLLLSHSAFADMYVFDYGGASDTTVEYLSNGVFVGIGDPGRDITDFQIADVAGIKLETGSISIEELPEACRVKPDDEVYVLVDYSLDLGEAFETKISQTGDSAILYAHGFQYSEYPVVTVGSFIPQEDDLRFQSQLQYRELSAQSRSLLEEDGFTIPDGFNIESLTVHRLDSELNPEETKYSLSAFLDIDHQFLRHMGGDSTIASKTGDGGVVEWTQEVLLDLTDLQPYHWWFETILERKALALDVALEMLRDPLNKGHLVCDPNNYVTTRIPDLDTVVPALASAAADTSGGGSLGLYWLAFVSAIGLSRSRRICKG